ncbi:MAG: serine/threonine protein kinase [Kiritimatiellae bacterium]|nr:serine/threonine protein kinase [Kiritimatiellia bacterium]
MTIGCYDVVRLLGKGGMSEVYEAENPRLGTRHAIKLFTYEKDDPEVRRRFETEGRLLAKLSHPRIVKVTDFGTDEATGKPYFVMDLVLDESGQPKSLSDVEPGTVDEETIGRWYDDLREGLAYIHSKGVVHRDLKLQNVLVGPDGHAVLTDFGVSKVFDSSGDGHTVVDVVNTIVKMREGRSLVMGSIGYMAPELEMGVAASPQSDWYALGVIVYRLLTGTWCDARTDVLANLETYDPVWRRILPKLLHANPQGRECLSYAEEKRSDREKAEFEAEERWLKQKSRGHNARHAARYIGAGAIILAAVLAWEVREFHVQREVWRLKLQNAGARPDVPTFEELFRVPAAARADDQMDESGAVTMPSRGAFEAARLDALVLTHSTLSSLAAGDITLEKAIADFESMRDMLSEDSDVSPFDNLRFGDADYMQAGDDQPLRMMFDDAIEKLQNAAEK